MLSYDERYNMLNVLVTGAGSVIGQAIIKSLRASSLEVNIIAADYFPMAVGLYWCKSHYLLPDILKADVAQEQWLKAVLDIVRKESVDIILVGLDFELELFASFQKLIEDQTGARVVVGEQDKVHFCQDKWLTVLFLRDHGLPFIPSSLPADMETFVSEAGFPLIVKPRRGFRSRNIFLVHDHGQLAEAVGKCPDPVIQKYVGDVAQEYTCGVLMLDGKLISRVTLRRFLKDGNTSHAFYEGKCTQVDSFVERLSGILRLYGPSNIQLRLTDKGPMVFEINPRFSGTTYIRALFGVNEVEILINKLIYKKDPGSVSLKPGVIMRYFEEQYVSSGDYQRMELS